MKSVLSVESVVHCLMADPSRQKRSKNTRICTFHRELHPLAPIVLAGGGGWRDEKMLDLRAFLAFRQLPALAEGVDTAKRLFHGGVLGSPKGGSLGSGSSALGQR